MLVPCVLTYVVVPPSPVGQNNHTVASTSAARALVLATLGMAVMEGAPKRSGRGDLSAAPPSPALLVRGDRQAGLVEGRDEDVRRQRARDGRGRGHARGSGSGA